ncbi:MAG: flagellar hook-basal body complex protein, partial [Anaerovibrio sp.]|uniref:flagellar hook-basal body complex protein n=1 Tax=Anaerovibrio sp. TaxID=1872532 RepID=UPI002630AB00
MMRSLYSGISGLKSHQTAMDVVGNNISNVNTTGFKSSRVTFADTLNQTLSSASAPAGNIGGINAKQIGLGSGVAAIDTIFTDGSVKSTGLNTDMCLSGNGLFVVHSESSANEMYYTRNGNFKFDASGNFVTSDGYKVQGWVADASGNITVDPSKTSDITIPAGKVMEATKTEKAVYNSNLNSGEATVTGITMMDNNGSKIVVSQNNVDTLSCGSKYNDNTRSKINNVNLEFKEGCTIVSAKGQYAMTQNYALDGDLTISCSNGDKITVPKTSPNSYKMGAAVSLLPVQEITAGSKNVTLSDTATYTNDSNSPYIVNLANGDVLTVTAPPGATFTKGAVMPTLTVTGIAGKEITLTDVGGTNVYKLTNNSGNSYAVGNTISENVISISIDSTDTMSNAKGTVKSADGTVDNFTMRSGTIKPASGITVSSMELTDNLDSVITVSNANVRKYKVGDKYEGSIDSMALTMSDGSSTSEVSGSYTMGYSKPLSTLITVYDTLGNEHNIT